MSRSVLTQTPRMWYANENISLYWFPLRFEWRDICLAGAAAEERHIGNRGKKMLSKTVTCLMLLTLASLCFAQQNTAPPNAQPRVAPALQECYRRRELFERDNRLPMTPNMLIELIRKVEDSPGFTQNIQQFTSSLLHRFKQDGIIRKCSINKFFQSKLD